MWFTSLVFQRSIVGGRHAAVLVPGDDGGGGELDAVHDRGVGGEGGAGDGVGIVGLELDEVRALVQGNAFDDDQILAGLEACLLYTSRCV